MHSVAQGGVTPVFSVSLVAVSLFLPGVDRAAVSVCVCVYVCGPCVCLCIKSNDRRPAPKKAALLKGIRELKILTI